MAIEHTIPIINITPFLDELASEEARDEVVSTVRDACVKYGFFQLVGHGIPLHLQQTVLGCSKIFFDLPLEKKQELSMSKSMGLSNRGYEMIGGQQLQADARPDQKEGLYIGREIPADDPRAGEFLQGPNLWPDLPDKVFKEPVKEYRERMLELGHLLLKILALGLPYSPNVFDSFMQDPVANIRLLHCPPQKSIDEKQLGAGAHTDFGCITLLLQQPNYEGLQVLYPPTNNWIPVPVVEDRFVVNIGHLLERWTRGHYRSATHRVLNVGDSDRYSVPFFYNGNLDTLLAPLDGSPGPAYL